MIDNKMALATDKTVNTNLRALQNPLVYGVDTMLEDTDSQMKLGQSRYSNKQDRKVRKSPL